MKLTERFYANSYGVNGLVADLPTKKPKRKKEPKIKVGDMVQCEAEEFIYPFRGYVEQVLNHSAIIRIVNTMKCDVQTAKDKCHVAVVRIKDIEVMK